MKKQLLILLLFVSVFARAQTPVVPVLTVSIPDANLLPSMMPSTAHYKVDRVYGQNLQTQYRFIYGTPTGTLSPALAALHLNIISTYVDPVSGPVVGYWSTEKVYGAFDNTIDFRKSTNGLVSLTTVLKSDSTRIAVDSTNLATNYDTRTVTATKFRPITYTPTKADIGLGNVDNTSDANKPISTAMQTALNGKEPTITAGTTSQYWRGDKTWQTLPVISYPVTSVFGRTGAIVAANGDYTTSQITENTNLYFTQARVLSTPLTGYTTGTSTPITATNTMLNGMQNLQAQITAINNNMVVNSATVGLTKAQLNTAYPNVGFGYMVFCPSIILGGAIYIKNNSLTGTSGTWQTISAPPTL